MSHREGRRLYDPPALNTMSWSNIFLLYRCGFILTILWAWYRDKHPSNGTHHRNHP